MSLSESDIYRFTYVALEQSIDIVKNKTKQKYQTEACKRPHLLWCVFGLIIKVIYEHKEYLRSINNVLIFLCSID